MKSRWLKIIFCIVFAVVICGVYYIVMQPKLKARQEAWDKAWDCLETKQYDEALEYYNTSSQHDRRAFINLRLAMVGYDKGAIKYAKECLDKWNTVFELDSSICPQQSVQMVAEFQKMVNIEYDALTQKETEFQKAKEEKRKQEYEEKVKNGIPFVGMQERDIGSTILGHPYDSKFKRSIYRDVKDATIYWWYVDGYLSVSARVEDGVVVVVSDKRELIDSLRDKKNVLKRGPSRLKIH